MNSLVSKISIALALVLIAVPVWSIKPTVKIITQESSPIIISSYSAEYKQGSRYVTEGIHHSVEYINTSKERIVAVQIGLVSFDVWDEFLHRMNGLSIDDLPPGSAKKATWIDHTYGDFSFLTGVAYVSKVRFDNGTIWSADLNAIAEEIGEIEKNFSVEKLKEKTEGKD